MRLILEVCRHGDDDPSHYLAFNKFPVIVGRGFAADLILNDPYVDATHLQIDYNGDTCMITDVGSENGFTLNGREPEGLRATAQPGDRLQIGHTEIRLLTPDVAVPPALPLQRQHPLLAWLARPLTGWLCLAGALTAMLSWGYMEIWSDEISRTLAGVIAGTLGTIIIWSSIWAAAGRMTRHRAHFKSHVGLISLYLIAGTAFWYLEIYVDFLTNENWLSSLVTYGINFALLGALLYGSLALATRMSDRRRGIVASLFSFGVVAGIFFFTMLSAKTFNQQPFYPATLEPYLSGFAPADTLDAFMTGNGDLFRSDIFDTPAK